MDKWIKGTPEDIFDRVEIELGRKKERRTQGMVFSGHEEPELNALPRRDVLWVR